MTRPTSAAERVWRYVDRRADDECWPWTGSLTNGYGLVYENRTSLRAHRVVYELLVGPIPEGLVLDHLCRVRHCCNPRHMEPVTNAENMRRGALALTHCKRGHEFTPDNTYLAPGGRQRVCRTCRRLTKARWRQKQRMEVGG